MSVAPPPCAVSAPVSRIIYCIARITKLGPLLVVCAAILAMPALATAKITLHGQAKYYMTWESYLSTSVPAAPPREFLMSCLTAAESTVNPHWGLVTFRYAYISHHPQQCPVRYVGNGWSLVNGNPGWLTTAQGDEGCPTYKSVFGGPRMPRAVGTDLFGPKVCPPSGVALTPVQGCRDPYGHGPTNDVDAVIDAVTVRDISCSAALHAISVGRLVYGRVGMTTPGFGCSTLATYRANGLETGPSIRCT